MIDDRTRNGVQYFNISIKIQLELQYIGDKAIGISERMHRFFGGHPVLRGDILVNL